MCVKAAALMVRRMFKLQQIVIALMLVCFASGCFRWAAIDNINEVASASRVRVEAPDSPAVVLDHPSVDVVRDFAAAHPDARVRVKKVNAWATALIVTGAFLATAFTALLFLGVAVAGAGSG